jgi:hypothetical protein
MPVGANFFIFGDYTDTESDFSFVDNTGLFVPGDTDVKRLNLGGGFFTGLSAQTDLVVSAAYTDIDYDDFDIGASPSLSLNNLFDDPSDGFMADIRLRSQLSQALEGGIGVRYTDIESIDGLSLIGNLLWEFTPNWGLNVSLDAGDDLMTWGAGVRYTF